MAKKSLVKIHKTAAVDKSAEIGTGTEIWDWVKVRENAKIGKNCIIHKGVFIDQQVQIGNTVKIQVDASLFKGLIVEDGAFIGPHVCFTNDKLPRSTSSDGNLKKNSDWDLKPTVVKEGASVGAAATVLPGITIGRWAMVGAGAVVTKNVPDFGIVVGNPAKLVGYADKEGKKVRSA